MSKGGECSLAFRFTNQTGNEINFDESKWHSPKDIKEARIALSIDSNFKNHYHRTVGQMVEMVARWHIVSNGYYDYRIGRWVSSMTLC